MPHAVDAHDANLVGDFINHAVVAHTARLTPCGAWFEGSRPDGRNVSGVRAPRQTGGQCCVRARRGETRWFYTDRPTLAFAARMVMPPELVVVPQKRVRTGRMTEAQLVGLLQRYRPEQMVVFGRELHGPLFAEFVASGYRRESAAEGREYFVRSDLAAKTGVTK